MRSDAVQGDEDIYHSDKLVSSAAIKPSILKLSSVAEHNANPTMMGIRDKPTYSPVFSPKKKNILKVFTI